MATVLIVAALGLAACGDGEESGTTAEDSAQTAEQEALVRRGEKLAKVALQTQQGKPMKEQIRIANAAAELWELAKQDRSVLEPVIAPLKRRDLAFVAQRHALYIQLGKPGSEPVLAEALNSLGAAQSGSIMALAFLGSGNAKLERAARSWASSNGFTVSGNSAPALGSGWGFAGVYEPNAAGAPPAVTPQP